MGGLREGLGRTDSWTAGGRALGDSRRCRGAETQGGLCGVQFCWADSEVGGEELRKVDLEGLRQSIRASLLVKVGEAEPGVSDTEAPKQADGNSSQALGYVAPTHVLCPPPQNAPRGRGQILSFRPHCQGVAIGALRF